MTTYYHRRLHNVQHPKIKCDELTVGDQPISDFVSDLDECTQNQSAEEGETTFSGSLAADSVSTGQVSCTGIGVTGNATLTGDLTVDTNTLKVDTTNNRVGVLNSSPSYPLDVVGDINLTGNVNIEGSSCYGKTSIGSTVTTSSLTSVGTLNSLNVSGNSALTGKLSVSDTTSSTSVTPFEVYAPNVGSTGSTYARVGQSSSKCITFRHRNDTSSHWGEVKLEGGTINLLMYPQSTRMYGDSVWFLNTAASLCHVIDNTNKRIGIGVSSPAYSLDVSGDVNLTGNIRFEGTTCYGKTSIGSTVASSSLTSVGTLTSLNVSGNTTVGGNLAVTGKVTRTVQHIRRRNDSLLTFTESTPILLEYGTESVNQGSLGITYSGGTFTNTSGSSLTLLVALQNAWNATGGYREHYIRIDDSDTYRYAHTNNGQVYVSSSDVIVLPASSQFKVYVYHTVTGGLTIATGKATISITAL